GAGSGTNRAMGAVIAGGQSLALVLTLVATPVIYSWLDDLWFGAKRLVGRVGGLFGGGERKSAGQPVTRPAPPEHPAE
ncbi:MAG: efflux RND transporter permease subunit, partial [Myxococcales bacterium]|nr:efflux RND transporter permease subunit [Myxococcales bacterium]